MIEKVKVTNKQNPEIKAFPLKALDVQRNAEAVVVSAVDGSIRIFPYSEWKVEIMDWVELVQPSNEITGNNDDEIVVDSPSQIVTG